ncbi:heavy-metal-associated domain-containing protein [Hephaestia mangrovi]|uniref:heavy-metal-associated domain-containing protein n=1 Tax=Hephaestia mangrovi TaxID=2873268 RepID=UPI001CA6B80C|nr:heavy-metal-associated domain-containing protein [Hephaestia mangrovi]MBY8827870.1 heavy-metal-associated domain-containing protein [Hephaestia mangrovi]
MIRIRLSRALTPLAGLLAIGGAGVVLGQVETSAPIAPIDDSGNFEVDGVSVDVTGKTSEEAREAGWRLAQRKAWQMLSKRLGQSGALVPDSTLNGLVSGIIVENENIGPDRYVARLGVTFSRARAGPLLGVAGGGFRSPPMVVLPIEWTGGVGEAFEQETGWRQAWARFRTGNSAIDYVRPAGTGPDSLLLNAGQAGRPGRGWWKAVLDQYGASDVLIPTVHLYRQYPGGPVIGHFEARYGPDDRLAGSATLRVANADGIDALLDAGVKRIDSIYQDALKGGILRTDPGLAYQPTPTPTPTPIDLDGLPLVNGGVATAPQGTSIDVQFDTPDAAAVNAGEAALRAIPGVGSAATTSLAMGGVSVMRVTYAGDQGALAAQLQARGWQVQSGPGALRIRRAAAPPPNGQNGG